MYIFIRISHIQGGHTARQLVVALHSSLHQTQHSSKIIKWIIQHATDKNRYKKWGCDLDPLQKFDIGNFKVYAIEVKCKFY
jgi:hypothetical protein